MKNISVNRNLYNHNKILELSGVYTFKKLKIKQKPSDEVYSYYLYSFFLKKNFHITKKSTNFGVEPTTINSHLKNSFLFLQSSFKFGKKLKMLTFLNKVNLNFYSFFKKKFEFIQKKYTTYNIYYSFSKSEKKFFDIDFLLSLIIKNNESIFQTKAVRINKKIKKKNKTKLKYSLDIKYLKSDKRPLTVLKQVHLYSNHYNFYKYDERLLLSFFNVFFFEKNSDIHKNKLITYMNVLKKNSK